MKDKEIINYLFKEINKKNISNESAQVAFLKKRLNLSFLDEKDEIIKAKLIKALNCSVRHLIMSKTLIYHHKRRPTIFAVLNKRRVERIMMNPINNFRQRNWIWDEIKIKE